jgi:hypothetical protein
MAPANYFNNGTNNQELDNTPKSQNKAAILLSVLFVGVLALSVWQLVIKVQRPFQFKGEGDLVATNFQDITDRTLDTDGDGISDYDEIFIYGTSPYLEDTDGDGISDYDEIFVKGTDPKCPEGQDCFYSNQFALETQVVNPANLADDILGGATAGLGDINVSEEINETELKRALAGDIDAPTLRQLLLDSGADSETLSQISDEDLLASYQEVLNSQNAN